jgi:predicted lysophospholipase L1 biosynthesis ABC-type transport system permease subunit
VVLVSQCLARRFWPGPNGASRAVGQEILHWGNPFRVVGVVADVKHGGLEEDAEDEMYFLYDQMPEGSMTLSVRSAREPAGLSAAIRGAVRAQDPDLPLTSFRTMTTVVDATLAPRRFQMRLLGAFAALALLLAVVGIYGVMAYSVSQRTHEIGIRMAVGASPNRIRAMVVAQAVRLVGLGVVLGLLAALCLTRVLAGLLFGVEPTDPFTFASVAVLLAGVGLAASCLAVRYAARIAPWEALRCE